MSQKLWSQMLAKSVPSPTPDKPWYEGGGIPLWDDMVGPGGAPAQELSPEEKRRLRDGMRKDVEKTFKP